MTRSPTLAYTGPMVCFLGALAAYRGLQSAAPALSEVALQAGFLAVMLAAIALLAGPALTAENLRIRNWPGTVLLGILVFAIWIAPDLLFPGYRHHLIFENPVTGTVRQGLPPHAETQTAVLWMRAFRAAAIVPVAEELFWRGWLMRWILKADFLSVPLGAWTHQAFWVVAVLFAAEHGPYWDVGLAAGILYNWWMIRSKSLGSMMLAHAVTNACLSLYVVAAGRWEYWS